jgi:hypothetical protein
VGLFCRKHTAQLLHFGSRVDPPTSSLVNLARIDTGVGQGLLAGPIVRCSRSSTNCSSFARVSLIWRCLGPL